MAPGFSVINSNRMEDLRKLAVRWIKRHPLAPLEDEVFIVQSNGMAQWIKLALAQNDGCGISAAVSFQLPARFLWHAYRTFLEPDTIPVTSPYDKEPLKWRLMRLLNSATNDGNFPEIVRYLADDPDSVKRYQLAGRLADLYDQYQVYRADWLEDWARGRHQIRNGDGRPVSIPSHLRWQAELWRLIQWDVPEAKRDTSRAHLHERFLKAARSKWKRPPEMPRRVIIFGISTLPQQAVEALHALSGHIQILFFLLNPCRHFWGDIREKRELLKDHNIHPEDRGQLKVSRNKRVRSLHHEINPLLASWGKQGRDTIDLIARYEGTLDNGFAEIDLFSDAIPKNGAASLLHRVQQAILDLKPPPGAKESPEPIHARDRSITFQQAYSRQREVEALQDHLLGLFREDSTLTPQDIIVMTPDIDVYTPHIESVFGNLSHRDTRFIPFAIADRRHGSGSAMLGAFLKLLNLPNSRMTQSDVLDLLQVPAFRRRFGLEETDVGTLKDWIDGAGIRWGLNEEQRTAFDLPSNITANTWRFGLRRMLLGYAVGGGKPWKDVEPYDEIGGLEAELVGPLNAICSRLEKYWDTLRKPAPPTTWYDRIMGLINDFFHPPDDNDRLTRTFLQEILESWHGTCLDADLNESLTLSVVRDALVRRMEEERLSQRFLAGAVNFCTLMPMRAIPFKIVCLLGMNDGEYPRSNPQENFDLMALPGFYRPGDRSRREDDRYLLLEALLSARERLVISYIARDVRDNTSRMPSVLVSQLRDYLAEGWRVETDPSREPPGTQDQPLLDQLTCLHPLQPFSKAYFDPRRSQKYFTHAFEWRKMLAPKRTGPDLEILPPAEVETGPVLMQWVRCLKNPVKAFFNQRLNTFFDDRGEANRNRESFSLDGLAPFDLGRRLLTAGLTSPDTEYERVVLEAAGRLRHTGELPPGSLGAISAEKLSEPVLQMLAHHFQLARKYACAALPVEIRFPLQIKECNRKILEDWLDGLRTCPSDGSASKHFTEYARWSFYPLKILDGKNEMARPESMVELWVKHLAGCAQKMALTSILIAPDGLAKLHPLAPERAATLLTQIADFWWQSLHRPLPVTAKTALSYLKVILHDTDGDHCSLNEQALDAARKRYEGDGHGLSGELGYADGIYLKRFYPDFDALRAAESDHFFDLAHGIYEPLFKAILTDTIP